MASRDPGVAGEVGVLMLSELGLDLLRTVERMVAWTAEHEPERLERPGMVRLAAQASAVRAEVEAGLSDPPVTSAGLTDAVSLGLSEPASPADLERGRALDFVHTCGDEGATSEDIAVCLGLDATTEAAIRDELVREGLMWDSGCLRPSLAGDDLTVWTLSVIGRERLADGSIPTLV